MVYGIPHDKALVERIPLNGEVGDYIHPTKLTLLSSEV